MCSAVCQQSHSRVPTRTDQSRSVIGSSPLITHEITLSRSSAVTVIVPSSLRSLPGRHDQFTRSQDPHQRGWGAIAIQLGEALAARGG